MKGIGTAPPTKRTPPKPRRSPPASSEARLPLPLVGLEERESAALPAESE